MRPTLGQVKPVVVVSRTSLWFSARSWARRVISTM